MLEKSKIEESKSKKSIAELIKGRDYKGLSKHLEDGIKDYLDSETFTRYLQFVSQFHQYSLNNNLLIMAQNRQASRVAGFQTWKKLDRNVKKGSKALYVYAPLTRDKKDKDGKVIVNENGQPEKVISYRLVPVFDVSQTEGEKELPKLVYNIEKDLEDPKKFATYYRSIADFSPVPIDIEPISSTANGYYIPLKKRIVIKEGLGQVMTIKVMLHEITHARLHSNSSASFGDDVYRRQEFEAESVAYIVSDHLGLDTSDYSFGYLSSWTDRGNDLSHLTESLEKITNEAKKIITEMDETIEKIYTLDAPENKFEERVAIAKKKVSPTPREPKKEFTQDKEKDKKSVDKSINNRMMSATKARKD